MRLLSNFSVSQYPLTDGTNDISTSSQQTNRNTQIESFNNYRKVRLEKQLGTQKLSNRTVRTPVLPRVLTDKINRQKRIKGETKQDL